MTHKDSGWRPHLAMDTYKGYEMWDHDIGPHEVNVGNVEGEIADEGDESDE